MPFNPTSSHVTGSERSTLSSLGEMPNTLRQLCHSFAPEPPSPKSGPRTGWLVSCRPPSVPLQHAALCSAAHLLFGPFPKLVRLAKPPDVLGVPLGAWAPLGTLGKCGCSTADDLPNGRARRRARRCRCDVTVMPSGPFRDHPPPCCVAGMLRLLLGCRHRSSCSHLSTVALALSFKKKPLFPLPFLFPSHFSSLPFSLCVCVRSFSIHPLLSFTNLFTSHEQGLAKAFFRPSYLVSVQSTAHLRRRYNNERKKRKGQHEVLGSIVSGRGPPGGWEVGSQGRPREAGATVRAGVGQRGGCIAG